MPPANALVRLLAVLLGLTLVLGGLAWLLPSP